MDLRPLIEASTGSASLARALLPPRSATQMWFGRKDSIGGKQKLGPISKQGDRYLRRILLVGAHSVLRRARQKPGEISYLFPSESTTRIMRAAGQSR